MSDNFGPTRQGLPRLDCFRSPSLPCAEWQIYVRQLPSTVPARTRGLCRGSGTTQGRIGEVPGSWGGVLRQTAAPAARGLLVAVVVGRRGGDLRRLLRMEPG